MSEHTKAPWEAQTDLPYGVKPRIIGADGRLICEVGNAERDQQDRWEADAKLMASAPEMTFAISEAHSHLDSWRNALMIAQAHAAERTADTDDKAYWAHEIEAFDKAFAEFSRLNT